MVKNSAMKLIKYIGIFFLGCTNIVFAQSSRPEYFIDHYCIAPGEIKSFAYAVPTAQHFLQCNQDGPGADLGSVEWKFKGISFKNQIGNFQRLTLVRNDMQHSGDEAPGQFADSSGGLVFANLADNTDLYVTCRYSLTID